MDWLLLIAFAPLLLMLSLPLLLRQRHVLLPLLLFCLYDPAAGQNVTVYSQKSRLAMRRLIFASQRDAEAQPQDVPDHAVGQEQPH